MEIIRIPAPESEAPASTSIPPPWADGRTDGHLQSYHRYYIIRFHGGDGNAYVITLWPALCVHTKLVTVILARPGDGGGVGDPSTVTTTTTTTRRSLLRVSSSAASRSSRARNGRVGTLDENNVITTKVV